MGCDKEGSGCWAHIEWACEHVGFVRVFSGDQEFGDPYCYALTFVVRLTKTKKREGLIEFVCLIQVMKPCQYRAMRKAVREAGYGIMQTRIKDGVARTIEICKRGTR